VPIIGIDWRDEDASARNFLETLGNPYATVATDKDGRVVVDWGVYGAPESFLVNPQGVVVYKKIGPITPEEWNQNFASRLPAGIGDHKS
jgi:cytochrome c biogenesis protein CcmG, thiol:disulfide interchange protein DsbE